MYKRLVRPLLFKLDPEVAHARALRALHALGSAPLIKNLAGAVCTVENPRLEQTLFGIRFPNPVGLAAGLDKAAEALHGWQAFGFGFVELGAVTYEPQPGNPRPRVFRLIEDEALINRMGFNNPGAKTVAETLSWTPKLGIPLAANIGKSKVVPNDDIDAVRHDYQQTFEFLWPHVDFFVINVSSPNTPGLRDLQNVEVLKRILQHLQYINSLCAAGKPSFEKPLLVKIAPDLANEDVADIVTLVGELRISGIVATNTTITRPNSLKSVHAGEKTGGLSGRPVRKRALEVVRLIRSLDASLPIIGVGGIFSGLDAYEMILAGANLVQVCTGLIYEGPLLPKRINEYLVERMRDGGASIQHLHHYTRYM